MVSRTQATVTVANALAKPDAQQQRRLRSMVLYAMMLGYTWNLQLKFRPDIRTAMTDGKTIYLPPLDVGDDEDAMLCEGLITHEAGVHCRQTDNVLWEARLAGAPAILVALTNIFEDIWGERELAKVRPGCPRSISRALSVLITRGRFGGPQANASHASLLTGMLIHGLRLEKLGQGQFSGTYPAYRKALEDCIGPALVDAVWLKAQDVDACHDTASAIVLADEVLQILRGSNADPQPSDSDPDSNADAGGGEDGSGDDDGDDGDSGADLGEPGSSESAKGGPAHDPDSGGEPTEPDAAGDGGSVESGDSSTADADGQSNDNSRVGSDDSGAGDANGDSSPVKVKKEVTEPDGASGGHQAAVAAILGASEQQVGDSDLSDAIACALTSRPNDAPAVGTAGSGAGSTWTLAAASTRANPKYHESVLAVARPLTVQLGSRLEEKLEALTAGATQPRRYGRRLQPSRLVKLAVAGDARVFRASDDAVMLDTAALLLTDISVSMNVKLEADVSRDVAAAAVQQSLASILDRFDIPFAVAVFGASLTYLKEFEQRWSQRKAVYWSGFECSTCTDQALLSVVPRLALRSEARKILALITDGCPDNARATALYLSDARAYGIDVCVVIIGVSHGDHLDDFLTELDTFSIKWAMAEDVASLGRAVFDAFDAAFRL